MFEILKFLTTWKATLGVSLHLCWEPLHLCCVSVILLSFIFMYGAAKAGSRLQKRPAEGPHLLQRWAGGGASPGGVQEWKRSASPSSFYIDLPTSFPEQLAAILFLGGWERRQESLVASRKDAGCKRQSRVGEHWIIPEHANSWHLSIVLVILGPLHSASVVSLTIIFCTL